tara:strand:+ start:489 stop:683 length:195 start_codon:yes stop_codon:yes gene_type:complete
MAELRSGFLVFIGFTCVCVCAVIKEGVGVFGDKFKAADDISKASGKEEGGHVTDDEKTNLDVVQ